MAEGRERHAQAPQCLHCCLWDAINGYFRAAGQVDPADGRLLYDERLIYGHMADVLAEVIAGIPDRRARRQRLEAFDSHLRRKVAECMKRGDHVESRPVRLQ